MPFPCELAQICGVLNKFGLLKMFAIMFIQKIKKIFLAKKRNFLCVDLIIWSFKLSKLSKRSENRGIRSVSSIINNKVNEDVESESKRKEDDYVRIAEYEV